MSFMSLLARGKGYAGMKIEPHIKLLNCRPKSSVLRQIIEHRRICSTNLRT
jgi:hypothetical protein